MTNKQMIKELKEWHGWGDDMIEFIKKEKAINLLYKLMRRERDGS